MRIDRRTFSRLAAFATVGAACPGQSREALAAQSPKKLNIRVSHTGITWPWGSAPGPGPSRLADSAAIEEVVKDVASLGFYGLELFGWQIDGMEAHGGLGQLLKKHNLALVSSYGGPNLTDPAQRKSSIDRTVATAKLVKKYGGSVIVFGPNGVRRDSFNFA